jgi:hypothetical protein
MPLSKSTVKLVCANLSQCVERSNSAIELAAAVVGDDDAVHAIGYGAVGIFDSLDALRDVSTHSIEK